MDLYKWWNVMPGDEHPCTQSDGYQRNRHGGFASSAYLPFRLSTRIFYRGVPGFATVCPCGVRCLLYVGPLFGNLIWNDSGFVIMESAVSFVFFYYISYIYLYASQYDNTLLHPSCYRSTVFLLQFRINHCHWTTKTHKMDIKRTYYGHPLYCHVHPKQSH